MENWAGLCNALDRFADEIQPLRTRLLAWTEELDRSPGGAAGLDATERRLLVGVLERLVIQRVLVEPAFALLARLDLDRCKALLLRRYVGRGVSPDTKFGGFQLELSLLLGEIVEVGGRKPLAELVLEASFDQEKLVDERVLEALCDALSLESHDEVRRWVLDVRREGVRPAAASDYSCAGDPEAQEFCQTIAEVMVRLFRISRAEARGRIERQWRGQRLQGNDAAYHETPDFWAHRIYFGPDALWWQGTDGLTPLPPP